ncbi:hypothetical protein [Clostridium sp.]|uniref:hypothetical protein n=1 Tax=Clostridium sp. TaxID=1506 RepID=UPI0026151F65|nr:hypothetical protein [Clostridium sp.]
MLNIEKEYTRSELGIKRGNIQWKVKGDNNLIMFFINEGINKKEYSGVEYGNKLDEEHDILYICIGENDEWISKYMNDLNNFNNSRFFYRKKKAPVWYEYIYEDIRKDDNCIKITGKKYK